MSDYKSILGKPIKLVSANLDNAQAEGQVWYNSTTGEFKDLPLVKAWSSSGNMGTARYLIGSCGSQTAALGFGGYSGSNKNDTEEYNGFNWTAGGNLNTARWGMAGAGSQSAALAAGGFVSAASALTEEYNGTAWSEQNDMPTAMRDTTGAGTQTAAVTCGGNPPSPGLSGATQEYDGTNWTTSPGSMSVARSTATAFGLQTAAIVAGGNEPGINSAEQYDGTNWTSISNLNSPAYSLASAANGTTSSGITFGGASPAGTGLTQTEEWNGTSWTISSGSLAAGKWKLGGGGTASAGLKFGGGPPPSGNVATEEYNSSLTAITAAAWSSGGTIPISVHSSGSATNGPQNANLMFGGYTAPGRVDTVNEYNGSSWTSGNTTPSVYADGQQGGTQTAAFGAGGYQPSRTNATIEYDGTNWSAGGALAHPLSQGGGCGTLTAGLCFGGEGAPSPVGHNSTQEYNGSSWTTVNNMASPIKGDPTAFGIQTAAIQNSGTNPASSEGAMPTSPTNFVRTSQSYDGTTWTAVASSSMGGRNCAGFGTQSDGVSAGGEAAPATAGLYRTEQWDGTGWTNVANLSTNSQHAAPGGDAPAGLYMGGTGAPGLVNTTQEFTKSTTALNIKTISTS